MNIIIDRFDGEYAIIELPDKSTYSVLRVLFPDAVEGDVYNISKNKKEKIKRKKEIQNKFDKLKNNF